MSSSIISFSKDLAQQLFDSNQVFVVDFDLAWVWLGYATKASAKRKLTKNLIKDKDYSTDWLNQPSNNASGVSHVERIMLSVDAFKALGMMAGTEQGKSIREYFLDCERQAKNKQVFPDRLTGEIPIHPEIVAVQIIGAAIDVAMPKLSEDLRAGIKLEAIAVKYPEYRKALESAKPKILLDSPLLSPTQLGELMTPSLSPRAVNKRLDEAGLQKPTGEKSPAWEPIGKGLEYGQIVADTARGHGKTVQSCKWYASVVELLEGVAA